MTCEDRVQVRVSICPDLLKRVDLSAHKGSFSRSGEINRLIITAFEERLRERGGGGEITGHVL